MTALTPEQVEAIKLKEQEEDLPPGGPPGVSETPPEEESKDLEPPRKEDKAETDKKTTRGIMDGFVGARNAPPASSIEDPTPDAIQTQDPALDEEPSTDRPGSAPPSSAPVSKTEGFSTSFEPSSTNPFLSSDTDSLDAGTAMDISTASIDTSTSAMDTVRDDASLAMDTSDDTWQPQGSVPDPDSQFLGLGSTSDVLDGVVGARGGLDARAIMDGALKPHPDYPVRQGGYRGGHSPGQRDHQHQHSQYDDRRGGGRGGYTQGYSGGQGQTAKQHRGRYEPRHPSYRLDREQLREIADDTMRRLEEGWYLYTPVEKEEDSAASKEKEKEEGKRRRVWNAIKHFGFGPSKRVKVDLVQPIKKMMEDTAFYPDDYPFSQPSSASPTKTRIVIGEYSTLVGTRSLTSLASSANDIGILNFASAKKPGGGFLNGAQAQEESIARSSTLYPSLLHPNCTPFYSHWVHHEDPFYTDAMIWSPSVVLFKNDRGVGKEPVFCAVLTSAAVNAGELRRALNDELERGEMERIMKEARVWEKALKKERRREERERELVERIWQQSVLREERLEQAKLERKWSGEEEPASDEIEDSDDPVWPPGLDDDYLESEEESEEETEAPPPPPYLVPILAHESPDLYLEKVILERMKQRMYKILALFKEKGVKHLVLGSFGTGVFKNDIEEIAKIWKELLVDDLEENDEDHQSREVDPAEIPLPRTPSPSASPKSSRSQSPSSSIAEKKKTAAPFKNAFSTVLFAILGSDTVRVFEQVFGGSAERDGERGVSDVEADEDSANEGTIGHGEYGSAGHRGGRGEGRGRGRGRGGRRGGGTRGEDNMVFSQRAEDNPIGIGMHAEPLTSSDPAPKLDDVHQGTSEPGMPGVVEGVLVDLSTPPPESIVSSSHTAIGDLVDLDVGGEGTDSSPSKDALTLTSATSEEEKELESKPSVDEELQESEEGVDGVEEVGDKALLKDEQEPAPALDTSELALGGGLGLVGGVLVDLREPGHAAPGPAPADVEPSSSGTEALGPTTVFGSDISG